MSRNNIVRNAQRGNVGERFVLDNLSSLVSVDVILNLFDRTHDYVEGGDASAHFLKLGDVIPDFIPEYVELPGHDRSAREVIEYIVGTIEVKTDWNFLFRTNDNEELYGSLPFALWENAKRKKPGWALRIFYPEKYYIEGERVRSVQPMVLIFVLAAYQNVFACVAFENVPALIERVESLARKKDVELKELPMGEDAVNWDKLNIVDGFWPIPFSELNDLATVTMIGDKPRLRPDIISGSLCCSNNTQNCRYENLVSLSGERDHLPIPDKYRDAFVPDDSMLVFCNIDKNLSIIDNLDKYPALHFYRRQIVFKHLVGLMLNILSHPVPIWPEKKPSFFAIGNNYLEKWCKEHGIKASSKSMQGSLMFLRIIGLVRAFRPGRDYHDPIVDKIQKSIKHGNASRKLTLRSIPLYTDELLQKAEAHAQLYYNKEINISKLSKNDVIRVEGQEPADRYFMSSFKISNIEKQVEKACISIIKQDIAEKGYALFDEVIVKAQTQIDEEADFTFIDPFSEHTDEEKAELERQKKYQDAFKHFSEKKKARVKDEGITYRQITPADRVALNIPPEVTCWIFAKL